MTDNDSSWWSELLSTHVMDGRRDAERGVFKPPYGWTNDPMEQEENRAYERAWWKRRDELGSAFKWEWEK